MYSVLVFWMEVKLKVTFDRIEKTALNIYSFYFNCDPLPRYNAGQFIELKLPHDNKDKRGDKRWFTLSSSPTEPQLAITTKILPENSSSFKTALQAMSSGTEVNIAFPMGDFILPKDASIPLVFIAGGIGCTPFRSMAKYLQDSGETRKITLIYNANSPEEIAFKDIFSNLDGQFHPITDGRITAEKILEIIGNDLDQDFYLSGPEPMIEALTNDIKAAGVNKKRLRTDYFPGYADL